MAWIKSSKKTSSGIKATDCNIQIIDLGGGQGLDAVDFNIIDTDVEENSTQE